MLSDLFQNAISNSQSQHRANMEFKHFSHSHGLLFHQMPQGTEIQCSGCQFPGSGSVYTCWKCSFFLHEQCFRASRSLKHPSHPLHPLTLVPYPTYPSNSFYCNSCNLIGSGFCYSCSECEFDLHVHCAYLPSHTLNNVSLWQVPLPAQSIPNQTQSYINPQSFHHHLAQNSSPHAIQNNPIPAFPTQNIGSTPSFIPSSIGTTTTTTTTQATVQATQNYSIPVFPPQNAPIPSFNPTSSATNAQPPAQPTANTTQANGGAKVPPGKEQEEAGETRHFSHPHPLKKVETIGKDEKIKCSGCENSLTGSSYLCTEPQCNFTLHKSCFELPLEIGHNAHLDHPLTLLSTPPYKDGFTCNACLQTGSCFVYHCSVCTFDLHVECVKWPDSVKRDDHEHPLKLFYSSPVPKKEEDEDVSFVCDVCQTAAHPMEWIYCCHQCDFGTHLDCVVNAVRAPAEKSEEELIRETQLKLAVLQLLTGGVRIQDFVN